MNIFGVMCQAEFGDSARALFITGVKMQPRQP
jgi:hypothetical protein